jgi:thiamine-phosphate diphosphorylase
MSNESRRKALEAARLYVITGPSPLALGRWVERVLRAGCRLLQLRNKDASSRQLLDEAGMLRVLTRNYGALLIVNDRVDIALAAQADGVHLGQDDLPADVARQILGPDAIIGLSAGSPGELAACLAQRPDYVGVGPVYPTLSKADAGPAVGLEWLGEACRTARSAGCPVYAIGGIDATRAREVRQAGAHGAAVIDAVVSSPRPEDEVFRFLEDLDRSAWKAI